MNQPQNIFLKFEPVANVHPQDGELVVVFVEKAKKQYQPAIFWDNPFDGQLYETITYEEPQEGECINYVARFNFDQPAPVPNPDYPAIFDLMTEDFAAHHTAHDVTSHGNGTALVQEIVTDLKQRKEVGIAKYGVPLQAFNGRDALLDALQEIYDGAGYVYQASEEMTGIRERSHLRALSRHILNTAIAVKEAMNAKR